MVMICSSDILHPSTLSHFLVELTKFAFELPEILLSSGENQDVVSSLSDLRAPLFKLKCFDFEWQSLDEAISIAIELVFNENFDNLDSMDLNKIFKACWKCEDRESLSMKIDGGSRDVSE